MNEIEENWNAMLNRAVELGYTVAAQVLDTQDFIEVADRIDANYQELAYTETEYE